MIAHTPEPPYYAVIFTSTRTEMEEDYAATALRMVELATEQPGFLGIESARADIGITVSYWASLESIAAWKANAEHLVAQERGQGNWYSGYAVRVCLVQKDYRF